MKVSESLRAIKEALSDEMYTAHAVSIKEILVMPEDMTEEELYGAEGIFRHYCLTVSKRSQGKYAVLDMSGLTIDINGKSEYESLPSNRTEDFITLTRFSLEEAVSIAERHVGSITVMGRTFPEMKAWLAQKLES